MPSSRTWPPRVATGLPVRPDDIWLDDSSIVGSIGVISASSAFTRPSPVSASNAGSIPRARTSPMLDPFRPERTEDVSGLQGDPSPRSTTVSSAHSPGRVPGARLPETRGLFQPAKFWVGPTRVSKLGLADGHRPYRAQDEGLFYGRETRFHRYGPKAQHLLSSGSARRLGADLAAGIEDRVHWSLVRPLCMLKDRQSFPDLHGCARNRSAVCAFRSSGKRGVAQGQACRNRACAPSAALIQPAPAVRVGTCRNGQD